MNDDINFEPDHGTWRYNDGTTEYTVLWCADPSMFHPVHGYEASPPGWYLLMRANSNGRLWPNWMGINEPRPSEQARDLAIERATQAVRAGWEQRVVDRATAIVHRGPTKDS